MMMLIVDTNILVGELLRERGQELIQNPALTLYATERILDETLKPALLWLPNRTTVIWKPQL